MPTLVIKNLPEALHARLKLQSERNHRSVTGEVIALIAMGVAAPRNLPPLPPPVRLRRSRMLGIEEIETAIEDDLG
jgi:plasmid stability protein